MSEHLYISTSKLIFIGLVAAISIWFFTLHQPQQTLQLSLSQHTCLTNNNQSSTSFNLYIPTNYHSQQLAESLCNNTEISKHYHQVTINWQPRKHIGSETILTQTYDLIWLRDYRLQGLAPDYQSIYQPLVELPSYDIHWYSHSAIARLDKTFFAQKKIGLIDDPASLSTYQLPLTQLRQLNVDESQIVYCANYQSLVQKFLNQQLDVIPSISSVSALKDWPSTQQVVLAQNRPMGNWYVSNQVDAKLHGLLTKQVNHYMQSLQISHNKS